VSLSLDRDWPAEPRSVPVARAAVVAVAQRAGATPDALDDIRLAVSEAVTNAVVHAYVGVEPGPVHVTAVVRERHLEVEVRDEGGGLRARPDSPGLGVGLPLIAALAQTLQISNAPGEPSRIQMTFDLDTARQAIA
jgi:serine/threonine-protein kinase RsbW